MPRTVCREFGAGVPHCEVHAPKSFSEILHIHPTEIESFALISPCCYSYQFIEIIRSSGCESPGQQPELGVSVEGSIHGRFVRLRPNELPHGVRFPFRERMRTTIAHTTRSP